MGEFIDGVADSARAREPPGDGRLSPDELWTPSCNLFLDIISLKDIDPHLMLVVFLPALLFESACFGETHKSGPVEPLPASQWEPTERNSLSRGTPHASTGIDMGIFLKQLPQILLMAFPCMITASGVTALSTRMTAQ